MKAIVKTIYPFLFLIFCFALPLDRYAPAIPNIVMIALLVLFPFIVTKKDFKKLLKREIILFSCLIFYVAINSFLFQDFSNDIAIISKIGSTLLLVILFIPIEKTENLIKTLVALVALAMIISLYHLYFFYMKEGVFNFSFGSAINDVLIIDRLYLGFLCVLSIISSFALIGNKYNEYNRWYFANIVLCVVFVLLISSRIAIILLLLLFLLKIFYSKSKKEYGLFFLGVIALVIFAFMANKNLNERFFYTHSTQKQKSYIDLVIQWEPRVVIWECNYAIATNEKPGLKGLGFYKTRDFLEACYSEVINVEKRKNYFIQSRFNPHNQYIDFYLSTGVIGLLLFIALLGTLLRHRKSYYKVSLLLTIAVFAFIESLFQRQLGAYLFAVVLILILFPKTNQTSSIEQKQYEKD